MNEQIENVEKYFANMREVEHVIDKNDGFHVIDKNDGFEEKLSSKKKLYNLGCLLAKLNEHRKRQGNWKYGYGFKMLRASRLLHNYIGEVIEKLDKEGGGGCNLDPLKSLERGLGRGKDSIIELFYDQYKDGGLELEHKSNVTNPSSRLEIDFDDKKTIFSDPTLITKRKDDLIWRCFKEELIRANEALLAPHRWNLLYILIIFIPLIIPFAAGAYFTVIGPLAALFPLTAALIVGIPTIMTNAALADRAIMLCVDFYVGFEKLGKLISTTWKKGSRGKAVGIIILGFLAFLCALSVGAINAALVCYGLMLFAPMIGFSTTALSFIVVAFAASIMTGILIAVLFTPILLKKIQSLFEKKERGNKIGLCQWFKDNKYTITAFVITAVGTVAMHMAAYKGIAAFLLTFHVAVAANPALLAIIITACALSAIITLCFSFYTVAEFLEKKFQYIIPDFLKCLVGHLWIEAGKQENSLGRSFGYGITAVFTFLLGWPIFMVANILTFIIKRSNNHGALLEEFLLNAINNISLKTKTKTETEKSYHWLIHLIFAILLIPCVILTLLFTGAPYSPEKVYKFIVAYCRGLNKKMQTIYESKGWWASFLFFLKHVVVALFGIIFILPYRLLANTLKLVGGGLLSITHQFKEMRNAINNAFPGFLAALGGALVAHSLTMGTVGIVIFAGLSFVAGLLISVSMMGRNTFLNIKDSKFATSLSKQNGKQNGRSFEISVYGKICISIGIILSLVATKFLFFGAGTVIAAYIGFFSFVLASAAFIIAAGLLIHALLTYYGGTNKGNRLIPIQQTTPPPTSSSSSDLSTNLIRSNDRKDLIADERKSNSEKTASSRSFFFNKAANEGFTPKEMKEMLGNSEAGILFGIGKDFEEGQQIN